ncbi:hypothetical protein P4637_04445 [Halalkalibacterium halodurans]|uniref:hypothetical protein n=1 Tax=Halalkalibacterium halodurans TaxID=86665 RepID=UPI002E1CE688|nr:hypothetical protein [Halalkalibacterium halodurans]MED4084110.1 hypothetical protein [Halalkalibacterium halodurans]MED4104588.1 hypothetical protein [Halalkalibacterium halodurans]MED4108316.1 hypothetical protein [Halalkalibacterium halodurans]MED4147337.1 hypothetical protein [Halalkalibacterium halodurans]
MVKKNNIVLLLMVVWLGGCNTTAPADLLVPPAYTFENEELALAISQSLPPEARLSLPIQDNSISAVRLNDLNGNGKKEAVVIYKDETNEQRLLLLRQTDGRWVEWMTIEGLSYEPFDWVEITNVDEDPTPELLVGYRIYGEDGNTIDIYKLTAPVLQEEHPEPPLPVMSLPYSLATTGDVTGDGQKELLIVTQPEENLQNEEVDLVEPEERAEAVIYRMEQKELHRLVTVKLDEEKRYDDVAIGKVSATQTGFVLEARDGLRTRALSAFVIEDHAAKEVYNDYYLGDGSPLSRDINGDGIIEFPQHQVAPGQDPSTHPMELVYLENWFQWIEKKDFTIVARTYSDAEHGFRLMIPLEWGDEVTVRNKGMAEEKEETDFWAVASFELLDGRELFTIHVVPQSDWEEQRSHWKDNDRHYVILEQAFGHEFVAVFGEVKEQEPLHKLLPSEEELIKQFMLQAIE